MKIKIKQLTKDAVIPVYATDGSACFDLVCTNSIAIMPGREHVSFKTGLAVEIPKGYAMMIYSRSGHGFNQGLRLSNCVGVIDSDYRGELMVKLHNDSTKPVQIDAGARIAQAMIIPVPVVEFEVVDELGETVRGEGGLGSTGQS